MPICRCVGENEYDTVCDHCGGFRCGRVSTSHICDNHRDAHHSLGDLQCATLMGLAIYRIKRGVEMLLLAILGATLDAQMISLIAGLLVWMVASFVAWGNDDPWADVEFLDYKYET